MTQLFLRDHVALKDKVLNLLSMSRTALDKAIRAVREGDQGLADEVVAGDNGIDALENEIDHASLRLLALEQPWAGDLRLLIGCMRMTPDIEHIGDEAVFIAERARVLAERLPLPASRAFEDLCGLTLSMVKDAIAAFSTLDSGLAAVICDKEGLTRELNMTVFREMTEFMVAERRSMERALQLAFIAGSLRRACGCSINICENVIFITKGTEVKHHQVA